MGYGARALQCLNEFYSGEYVNLDEQPRRDATSMSFEQAAKPSKDSALLSEELRIRDPSRMPPLLQRLAEITPPTLDYLGVSYGLTGQLLRFWKRAGYVPLYLRQTTNELTGEHTCVMVRGLKSANEGELEWMGEFATGECSFNDEN